MPDRHPMKTRAHTGPQQSVKTPLPKRVQPTPATPAMLAQQAIDRPDTLTAADILSLQRMVGNRSTTNLIQTSSVIQRFNAGEFLNSLDTKTEEQREKKILEQLKSWKLWSRKSTRRKNVASLMKALSNMGYDSLMDYVRDEHPKIFGGEMAPEAEEISSEVVQEPEKIESEEYRRILQAQLDSLIESKAKWEQRKKDQSWQEYAGYDFEGEANDVQAMVGQMGEPGVISGQFGLGGKLEGQYGGAGAYIRGGLEGFLGVEGTGKGTVEKGKTSVSGSLEGEFFAGAREKGELTFALDNKYASIITKLEEEAKLGSWGEGSLSGKLGLTGLSMDAQAYLALGGQIAVRGNFDAKTKTGGVGLILEGDGTAFAGAEAGGEAHFSVGLTQGIAASVKANAFAGVKAEANGKIMFQLKNRPIFGVKGTAGVTFGAGGEVEATLKIPIFGDSEFGFKADAALGLGTSAGASVVLNMGNMALSAKEILLELRNLSTTRQGYESLNIQDEQTLQELTKLLQVYTFAIKEVSSKIKKFDKIPQEKRSLLV